MKAFLGIDVGTGSVRAGVFDERGHLLGRSSEPIQLFRPAEDFVEQSSDDIWRAVAIATAGALSAAGLPGDAIAGIGFDATCSLVVLDADDHPVTVSPSGNESQNIIVSVSYTHLR